MSRSGMGSHEYGGGSSKPTDDWLTPPHIIEALGPFDLDPCASVNTPEDLVTAFETYTSYGLDEEWHGLVWLNPPYSDVKTWVKKLSEHSGGGIALIFARTETRMFQQEVWKKADAILFLKGRLSFHHPVTGEQANMNAGAPSCLVGFGRKAIERLARSDLEGALVTAWRTK